MAARRPDCGSRIRARGRLFARYNSLSCSAVCCWRGDGAGPRRQTDSKAPKNASNQDLSHNLACRVSPLSLTPCFSWVKSALAGLGTVSTVWGVCGKPLKRFSRFWPFHTQLKQGVNEKG